MQTLNTNNMLNVQGLTIDVLVQNDRVVVCKVTDSAFRSSYLHYHAATGWKDLVNGETSLSRQMPFIVDNPFKMA